MTDDALPTPRSMPPGYEVSAWCRACQHTVQLGAIAAIMARYLFPGRA
jgi:hypothetical protein